MGEEKKEESVQNLESLSEEDNRKETTSSTGVETTNTTSNNNDEDEDLKATASGAAKVSPPITLLQEICSRNGFTAEYQLLSTEGSVHEPTFKIAVTVDDITVTASGQSKKKARHAAAREAIVRLRERKDLNFDGINFDSMTSVGEPTCKSAFATAMNEANPVGKLQEICMKMRVNPPDYETCDEKGLAHERIFVLSCTISSLNMTTLGGGRSKKLAKRQAAVFMLAKLENSEMYDEAENAKPGTQQGSSSLNMDLDDNSHFVRSRRLVTELCSRMDCSVEDLLEDIRMIEIDDVNNDLFYNLFQERLDALDLHCEFHFLTDTQCLVNVFDPSNNIVMTSVGKGKHNLLAMKNCVIRAYREMIALMKPLIGKDSLQHHQEAENLCPVATAL